MAVRTYFVQNCFKLGGGAWLSIINRKIAMRGNNGKIHKSYLPGLISTMLWRLIGPEVELLNVLVVLILGSVMRFPELLRLKSTQWTQTPVISCNSLYCKYFGDINAFGSLNHVLSNVPMYTFWFSYRPCRETIVLRPHAYYCRLHD